MPVRPMTQADIPSVASIAADAFTGDELFQYTYPHHATLPPSYRRQKLIRFKQRLVTPGTFCFVATLPPQGGRSSEGEIVGYACWRHSNGASAGSPTGSWADKLERVLLAVEMWYEKLVDRDCDSERRRVYAQATRYAFYASVQEYWDLSSIAVLKRCQRRGVGRGLMEWGMGVAGRMGVPITLETSRAGRRLYEGLGFEVVEVRRLEGEGLEGVVMMWEKGVRGGMEV